MRSLLQITLWIKTQIQRAIGLFESHSNIDKYLAKNVEPASTIKPGRKSKSTKNLEGTSSVRITTGSDNDKDNKSFTPYVSNSWEKKTNCRVPENRKMSAFKPALRVAYLKPIRIIMCMPWFRL